MVTFLLMLTIKLTRRRKPEVRNERRAVGGRVQRLVGPLFLARCS